jgi:hypothetical protein
MSHSSIMAMQSSSGRPGRDAWGGEVGLVSTGHMLETTELCLSGIEWCVRLTGSVCRCEMETTDVALVGFGGDLDQMD